jgi:probable phosphoglycerate mutase
MTTTLLVARHGETDWNREHRWLGQVDRPLTELGREQARELGRSLVATPIDAAYASDLSRAFDTATIALAGRDLGVSRVRDLRERFLGSWEGQFDDDLRERFPEAYARWKASAGYGADDAESYEAVVARVGTAIRTIAAAHPSETVLVVAHSGPCRVLQAVAAGVDFLVARRTMSEPPHAVAVRYDVTDGRIS